MQQTGLSHPRSLETLYRLALLAHGDAERAEQAVQAARARLRDDAAILDAAPLLLPRRWRRPRPRFDLLAAGRAGLTPDQRRGLLAALALLEPAQRLALGLVVLKGLAWDDAVERVAPRRKAPLPDPRPALGQAMALLPELEEQPASCRRVVAALLADQGLDERGRQHLLECASCRTVRQGWGRTSELLREALGGLFVVPPEVLDRLVAGPAIQERGRWGLAALLGGVGVLVLVLLLRGGGRQETAAPPETLTTTMLIERVLSRLDQPPPSGGILHEIIDYELRLANPAVTSAFPTIKTLPVTVERWYDYDSPRRLRMELRARGKNLYTVIANGRGAFEVQTDEHFEYDDIDDANLFMSTTVSPTIGDELFDILRHPHNFVPSYGNLFTPVQAPLDALSLARERPERVGALGEVTFIGRPAWLITIKNEGQHYLMTVDQETYAILDLRDFSEGRESAGAHTWRTALLEVRRLPPEGIFELSSPRRGRRVREVAFTRLLPKGDFFISAPPSNQGLESWVVLPSFDELHGTLGAIVWDSSTEESEYRGASVAIWHEYGMISLYEMTGVAYGRYEGEWTHSEAGRPFTRIYYYDEDENDTLPPIYFTQTQAEGQPMPTGITISIDDPLLTDAELEQVTRTIVRTLAPATEERLKDYMLPWQS